MLWFIGLGLEGIDGSSHATLKILKKAKVVYYENFTSPLPKSEQAKIKKIAGRRFRLASRWIVEDGKAILAEAKKNSVVLLSYGDPYIATTHIELRTRATLEKIRTATVHAASAIPSLVGECGLQYYKMGRPVTIMRDVKSWSTVYYTIYENMVKGLHSILILEYDSSANFFLDPKEGISSLFFSEDQQRRNVISNSTFGIVASRIGAKNQKITAGRLGSLAKEDFGRPPHTIIIPGRMHFTELDALKTVANCLDEPYDNSGIQKISDQMIAKYIPKAQAALDEVFMTFKDDSSLQTVMDNARRYIDDAVTFQSQGKEELAILSIGYAEGLIDALRLSRGMDPWK